MDMLFSPGRIGTAEIKNRLVMPSILTGLAGKNGKVTKELITFYEIRAQGGTGLIVTEAARVTPASYNSFQLGIYDDSFVPGLKELTDRIHESGAKVFIQLYHPGSQTTNKLAGGELLTPSGFASKGLAPQRCRAMTQGD